MLTGGWAWVVGLGGGPGWCDCVVGLGGGPRTVGLGGGPRTVGLGGGTEKWAWVGCSHFDGSNSAGRCRTNALKRVAR